MQCCRTIIFIALFSLCAEAVAQLSRGGNPLPVDIETEWVELEKIHTDALLLEDAWAAMTGKKSQRIAEEIPCRLDPGNSGRWIPHDSGMKIWRLGIRGSGAHALGLVFNRYHLEPGVKLYVLGPEAKRVLGAYTDLNNKASGMLPIEYLGGERLIIQMEVPGGADDFGDLQIGSVRHAYRPVFSEGPIPGIKSFGQSGSCNVDINCPEGANWQLVKRAVVMMVNGENCTGVLVNNTAGDSAAYLLTAAHCIFASNVNKAASTVFYFNYESPTCDGPDGIDYHTISGATLLATGDTLERTVDVDSLDFALLKLSKSPPDSLLPYFAGWSHSGFPHEHTVTIHHPSADVKKISADDDPPATDYHEWPYFSEYVFGSFWRIVDWEVGTTEGGSSGGPLFDPDQRVIGVLTGGKASCANSVNDYFTRFDYAWDYYPDSLRQLKYWLDPGNTGAVVLGGLDPVSGGIRPNEAGNSLLQVYPNPVRDHFTIDARPLDGHAHEIMILNAAGMVVSRIHRNSLESGPVFVGHMSPGIYILRVTAGNYNAAARFIIQR